MVEVIEKWTCPGCDRACTSYESARLCCEPSPFYVCAECDQIFTAEIDAQEHVATHVEADAFGLHAVPQAELEAAGQMRLIDA